MVDHSMTNAAAPKPIKETDAEARVRLEKENADLRSIANSQPTISQSDSKYMKDIDFLSGKKAESSSNKITVKAIMDHKNISLWTEWGKRIGPMHPNNAVYTYHKFRRLGRVLFTAKPSEAEIQTYYKTPKYIEWKRKYDLDRERKIKSKSGKGLDKVIDAMVKITGENRKSLISIIEKPASVKG